MTPRITVRESFTVLGVPSRNRRGSETPELFGRIWKNFEERRAEIAAVATEGAYFGVSFPTVDEDVTEYLAGMPVPVGTSVPAGLEARTVPGGEYAVFECPVESIGATYHHVFGAWLPNAPVQFDPARPPYEEYPEDTPGQSVRVHIPIRR